MTNPTSTMKRIPMGVNFPCIEEQILSFWKEKQIFSKTMQPDFQRLPDKSTNFQQRSYVFYDGPPFATGLPHYGHLLAGTIKDVIGRFFTMKGYLVDRRCGWDCHGVPVEFEIQKIKNLHGSKAIENYGIDRFNEDCRSIVLRYAKEWENFILRSGRWVDFRRQYRTMDLDYMESVWWVLNELWKNDRVYKSLKCIPYSWAINTPLSNFEANLNYKNVQDPAITVRFCLDAEELKRKYNIAGDINAWSWTTTPWTLPSNLGLAVGCELLYSLVRLEETGECILIADELRSTVLSQGKAPMQHEVITTLLGKELDGMRYKPLFPYFVDYKGRGAFRIFAVDFVLASSGTGIVHLAPYGEDDLDVFLANDMPIVDPVDRDGCFTEEIPDFSGLMVKDADLEILHWLKAKGAIAKHETCEHSYPFCWRTNTPLIYKPISSWFIKVEDLRDRLIKLNKQIHWVPEHIGTGRMGKWLEGAKDWAISRNRFWGTPLPLWECNNCGKMECFGSVEELTRRSKKPAPKDLHRHFVDGIVFPCSSCSGNMHRVEEVLDCWFESGSMPYAQRHHPFENSQTFNDEFPADFIAEGVDQTRGWFYTLLIISASLYEKPAFENVIVNGIILAEDGKKMSKSLKNYPDPEKVMGNYGADAMRLYLLSSPAAKADELRFSESGVRDVVRKTLLPLWNAYNFFVTYALVEGYDCRKFKAEESKNILDRWILSRLKSLAHSVDQALSNYELFKAVPAVLAFVDQLTNWYIRLNRRRFWGGVEDSMQGFATLHRVLLGFVRVFAPLAPFISEEMFQNLKSGINELDAESVHHTWFPSDEELNDYEIDLELEMIMDLFTEIILLGRSIRNRLGIRIRQPLFEIKIIHPDAVLLNKLKVFSSYLREELNVKSISFDENEDNFVELKALLNTPKLGKILGPQLGAQGMKRLIKSVVALSTDEVRAVESGKSMKFGEVELSGDDIVVQRVLKADRDKAETSGRLTIAFDTEISPELRREGFAREVVNRIQRLRKEKGLEITDRITLKLWSAEKELYHAIEENKMYISREVLAVSLDMVADEENNKCEVEGYELEVAFRVSC